MVQHSPHWSVAYCSWMLKLGGVDGHKLARHSAGSRGRGWKRFEVAVVRMTAGKGRGGGGSAKRGRTRYAISSVFSVCFQGIYLLTV